MLKVLLAASLIPLGSIVTKKTGEKLYTLRDRLRVFDGDGEKREIVAYDNSLFIVSEDGNANSVSGNTELCWYAEHWQIRDYLGDVAD